MIMRMIQLSMCTVAQHLSEPQHALALEVAREWLSLLKQEELIAVRAHVVQQADLEIEHVIDLSPSGTRKVCPQSEGVRESRALPTHLVMVTREAEPLYFTERARRGGEDKLF